MSKLHAKENIQAQQQKSTKNMDAKWLFNDKQTNNTN